MSAAASPRARRILRAYGPLIVVAIAFLLLALLVPTLDRTETAPRPAGIAGAVS